MNKFFRKAKGFTLIELMIVVAIIGVLAVLGIYGVRRYMSNAKSAEARANIGQIATNAQASYDHELPGTGAVLTPGSSSAVLKQLCSSASNSVPATAANVQAKKYQSSAGDWTADVGTPGKGFACLRFVLDSPQYYQYTYASTGGGFTATANGDLDGNGTWSTFALAGTLANGIVNVAPTISETNPDE